MTTYKNITYKNKQYKSLSELCRKQKISFNKVYHRIKYFRYTIEDAIKCKNNSRASRVGIRISMSGKVYDSITQLCNDMNIAKMNVYYYKNKGLNNEDAIKKVIENKNKITYKEICKREGISRQRLHQLKNSDRKANVERYNKIMQKYGKKGA